jgi:histidyl-tRNA synthetase
VAEKIQAPRGTFDVLPEEARGRRLLEEYATEILEPAGYGRIETPAFEVTELFARGVEMTQFGPGRLRAVTHMDVDRAGVDRALVALSEVL